MITLFTPVKHTIWLFLQYIFMVLGSISLLVFIATYHVWVWDSSSTKMSIFIFKFHNVQSSVWNHSIVKIMCNSWVRFGPLKFNPLQTKPFNFGSVSNHCLKYLDLDGRDGGKGSDKGGRQIYVILQNLRISIIYSKKKKQRKRGETKLRFP